MKKLFKNFIIFFVFFFCLAATAQSEIQNNKWVVVGAGPAGIAVIGLLLDLGIEGSSIVWLDPEFDVGRLGHYYETVPGNAPTWMYVEFLTACKVFNDCAPEMIDELKKMDQKTAFPLHVIVRPLRAITQGLLSRVQAIKGSLISLHFDDDLWHVGIESTDKQNLHEEHARFVVLATGSHPKELNYEHKQTIPLDLALDKSTLASYLTQTDVVGVFGSAHSAILILKYLSELPIKYIVNFYNKPIVYTVDMGTWVQNQNAGLKGSTAQWAKEVLEKKPPKNLARLKNKPAILRKWLPLCTKLIYAIGFERNELPPINGTNNLIYDDISGVIGPRLFGIGIAFPEKFTYPDGNIEYRVGLKFFMEYAQRVVPEWLLCKGEHAITRFSNMESLFMINVL